MRRSHIAYLLCGALALSTTTGCAVFRQREDKKQANDAARQLTLDKIKGRLALEPNVVDVQTVYVDSIAVQATLTVTVQLAKGAVTDLDPTLDAAEREVWLSDVRPLRSLSLVASDHPGSLVKGREVSFEKQAVGLAAKYGPRPTGG